MQRENEVQHVFLVGAKSLGAYGGYETFVYKLTEYHQNKENIKYHVACKANGDGCMDETKVDGATRINDHEFEFHNAHCFKIDIPQIGPAQAIYYDVAALNGYAVAATLLLSCVEAIGLRAAGLDIGFYISQITVGSFLYSIAMIGWLLKKNDSKSLTHHSSLERHH